MLSMLATSLIYYSIRFTCIVATQHQVRKALKSHWCIAKHIWHHFKFKQPLLCGKCHFLSVCFHYFYLPIPNIIGNQSDPGCSWSRLKIKLFAGFFFPGIIPPLLTSFLVFLAGVLEVLTFLDIWLPNKSWLPVSRSMLSVMLDSSS